jgi:hypothetical protein
MPTEPFTATIRTTDVDELLDMLTLVRSFAALDGRPVTVEYHLAGIAIGMGDATAADPPPPEVTPVLLGEPWSDRRVHEVLDEAGEVVATLAVAPPDDSTIGEHQALAGTDADRGDDEPVEPAVGPSAGSERVSPVSDPDGGEECLQCDDRFRTRRAVSDHIRAEHWDLVVESYSERGIKGIILDWGVAESCARRWMALIVTGDDEAA